MRVFGAEIMPTATVYESALNYELGRLARTIDRPHRDAANPAPRPAPRPRPGGDRGRARPSGVGHADRPRTRRLHARRPGRATRHGRPADGHGGRPAAGRGPGSHRALGAGPARARPDPMAGAALAPRRPARASVRRKPDAADRRPRRRPVVRQAGASREPPADRRGLRSHLRRRPRHSFQTGTRAERHRERTLDSRRCAQTHGSANRAAHRLQRSAAADDRRREGDGDHRRRRPVHDVLRGRPEPHPQRSAGCQADRQAPDRAGLDLLVQRRHGRPHRGEGVSRGAGDHQRRARHRPGRGRLPGLDHRLQRGVRGGPEHHRADEPCALHQPLSARPRRHRQLPGHRPQVRQRHGPLAAAADVRRLLVARGRPLRHAAAPAGRVGRRRRSS